MTESPLDERGGISTRMFNDIHVFRMLEHLKKLNTLWGSRAIRERVQYVWA